MKDEADRAVGFSCRAGRRRAAGRLGCGLRGGWRGAEEGFYGIYELDCRVEEISMDEGTDNRSWASDESKWSRHCASDEPPRDRSRGAWSGWDCSGSDYACASIAAKRAAGHCLRSETWPSPSSIRRNSPLVDSTMSTEKNGQSIRCATCSTSGGTVSRRP